MRSPDMPCLRPMVKHPGGKTPIAGRVFDLLGRPDAIAELFAGGLAVSCTTPTRPAVVAEAIRPLAALYRQLAADPAVLWAELDAAPLRVESREQFEALRAAFNADQTPAGYLVLNCSCFNGLARFNADGDFNAAVGAPLPRAIRRFDGQLCPDGECPNCHGDVGPGHRCDDCGNERERDALERLFARCAVFDDWRPLERAVALGLAVYADPPYVGTFGYGGAVWTLDHLAELATALPAGAVLSERRGGPGEAQGGLFRAASVDDVLGELGFVLAFEWTGRNAISRGERTERREGVWQKGGRA